jgi:nitroreductase
MIDLLQKRRSVRKFKNKVVEKDKISTLVQAALLSPSSRNLQPWEFLIVSDKKVLKQLAQSKKHGSSFLKGAPLGIVATADPGVSDVWIEDTSIACIIIQLAAESLGLSSCWIQIRERVHHGNLTAEQYVKQTLNIPVSHRVEAIVAVGYRDEEKKPHGEEDLPRKKIHLNSYGQSYV